MTGCDGAAATSVGFLIDEATDLTYQYCYSDPEPSTAIYAEPVELTSPLVDGFHVATYVPAAVFRDRAVVVRGNAEGAYVFNVGNLFSIDAVYCTGRGVVVADMKCHIDVCGQETANIVVLGGVPSIGQDCYHSCFRT